MEYFISSIEPENRSVLPIPSLNTKSPASIDVVESNQDLIDTVTWISDDINVINHNELTYQTSKKYDLIVYDIIQFDIPSD